MYEEILDQMQELLKDEIKNFNGDFGKLEQFKEVLKNPKGQAVLVFGQSRKAFSTRPSAGKH